MAGGTDLPGNESRSSFVESWAMADAFNPYHKWLGIPPEQQPPDHYRLLGVPIYTDDVEVLQNAADRAMAHLRTFQSGQHGNLSQQLLNEIAVANACLQDPDKRAAYDAQLGGTAHASATPDSGIAQAVPARRPAEAPPSLRTAEPAMPLIDTHEPVPSGKTAHVRRAKKKKRPVWVLPLAGAVAGLILLTVIGVVVVLNGRRASDADDLSGDANTRLLTDDPSTAKRAAGNETARPDAERSAGDPQRRIVPRKLNSVANLSGVDEPWAEQWTVVATARQGTDASRWEVAWPAEGNRPAPGRGGVLMIHPPGPGVPALVARYVTVTAAAPVLRLAVCGNQHAGGSWDLVVRVNGRPLGEPRSISPRHWHDLEFDLSPYTGRTAFIRIEAHPTGWYYEHAFLDYIALAQKDDPRPDVRSVEAAPTTRPSTPPATTSRYQTVTWSGHRYAVIPFPADRQRAAMLCERARRYLVRIESADEQRFIESIIEGSAQNYWIDGSSGGDQGTWQFSTGQLMPYTNWSVGNSEPSVDQEQYIQLSHEDSWQWVRCDAGKAQFFIAEWDARGQDVTVDGPPKSTAPTPRRSLDLAAQAEQLEQQIAGTEASEALRPLAARAIELSEQAHRAEQLELARTLASLALGTARKSGDTGLIQRATLNFVRLR